MLRAPLGWAEVVALGVLQLLDSKNCAQRPARQPTQYTRLGPENCQANCKLVIQRFGAAMTRWHIRQHDADRLRFYRVEDRAMSSSATTREVSTARNQSHKHSHMTTAPHTLQELDSLLFIWDSMCKLDQVCNEFACSRDERCKMSHIHLRTSHLEPT